MTAKNKRPVAGQFGPARRVEPGIGAAQHRLEHRLAGRQADSRGCAATKRVIDRRLDLDEGLVVELDASGRPCTTTITPENNCSGGDAAGQREADHHRDEDRDDEDAGGDEHRRDFADWRRRTGSAARSRAAAASPRAQFLAASRRSFAQSCNRPRHRARVERAQVLNPFADADGVDRQPEFLRRRDQYRRRARCRRAWS